MSLNAAFYRSLLLALLLALPARAADPYGKGGSDDPYGKRGLAAGVAIDKRLTLGSPIQIGGVSIFPIRDREAPKRPLSDAIPLAAALASGQLVVGETSGGSGQVALLQVQNRGKEPVLALAGEVLQGGRQDRVLVEDLYIPPSAAPVLVRVNCVERGRWSEDTGAFGYGGRAELALRQVVEEDQDQSTTWAMVAALNAQAARAPDGAYAPAADAQWAAVRHTIRQRLSAEPQVVGVVVAAGDRVLHAEIFGDPALFMRHQDSAIDGYARDALALADSYGGTPDPDAVAAFVRDTLASGYRVHDEDGDLLHLDLYAQ